MDIAFAGAERSACHPPRRQRRQRFDRKLKSEKHPTQDSEQDSARNSTQDSEQDSARNSTQDSERDFKKIPSKTPLISRRLRAGLQEDSEHDSGRSREDSEQRQKGSCATPRKPRKPRRPDVPFAPKTIGWRAILRASARYNRINVSSSRRPSSRPPIAAFTA